LSKKTSFSAMTILRCGSCKMTSIESDISALNAYKGVIIIIIFCSSSF
jgi:hypothetical protein